MENASGSNYTLESYRLFPYVAWTLIVMTIFFVYQITVNLRTTVSDLVTQNDLQMIEYGIKKQ